MFLELEMEIKAGKEYYSCDDRDFKEPFIIEKDIRLTKIMSVNNDFVVFKLFGEYYKIRLFDVVLIGAGFDRKKI